MNEPQKQTTSSQIKKFSFFDVLARTRKSVSAGLANLFASTSSLDQSEIDKLYDALILSDVGYAVSESIIDSVSASMKRSNISGVQVANLVRRKLIQILEPAEMNFNLEKHTPPVIIMMVGVNGVGKTTTSAKIAGYLQQHSHSVMLAACDTFRPAAIEQLQTWGERLNVQVIAQSAGADPAAVAHDAMHAATARDMSILLIDTGGRQQTRDDLMRQLGKIRRVVSKIEPSAPHETLITIDAGTGQNAISQVEQFHKHSALSGICVSKLDGTARGGIVVALTQQFALPLPFIGVGEGIGDIAPFKAADYVDSLLGIETTESPVN